MQQDYISLFMNYTMVNTGAVLTELLKESGITAYRLTKIIGFSNQRIYQLKMSDNMTIQLMDEILYHLGKSWSDFDRIARKIKNDEAQAQKDKSS